MARKTRRFTPLGLILALAVLTACIPIFTDGAFQTLRLVFRLDNTLPEGEATLIHSVFFPRDVKLKKNFVQVSGRLMSSDGTGLPGQITVTAQAEDATTGKKGLKVTLKVTVQDDGTFSANSKLKKSIKGGELMMVTVQPAGGAVPKGAELTVCVDLVKKKGDLNALPDCIEGDDDGGGEPVEATFTSLQNDFFTPTCAVAGCHNSATAREDLVLEAGVAYGNLVSVRSQQVNSLNRVQPNDPENSYLIKKLRGDADIEGDRMPDGGPFLTEEQIDRFVRWINDGAPEN